MGVQIGSRERRGLNESRSANDSVAMWSPPMQRKQFQAKLHFCVHMPQRMFCACEILHFTKRKVCCPELSWWVLSEIRTASWFASSRWAFGYKPSGTGVFWTGLPVTLLEGFDRKCNRPNSLHGESGLCVPQLTQAWAHAHFDFQVLTGLHRCFLDSTTFGRRSICSLACYSYDSMPVVGSL